MLNFNNVNNINIAQLNFDFLQLIVKTALANFTGGPKHANNHS